MWINLKGWNEIRSGFEKGEPFCIQSRLKRFSQWRTVNLSWQLYPQRGHTTVEYTVVRSVNIAFCRFWRAPAFPNEVICLYKNNHLMSEFEQSAWRNFSWKMAAFLNPERGTQRQRYFTPMQSGLCENERSILPPWELIRHPHTLGRQS